MISFVGLLGGPASGKRSVGSALADRLEWEFIDFDTMLERHQNRPIGQLLETLNQDAVHDLTRTIMEQISSGPESVVAFDGRWPGNLTAIQRLRPDVLAVWLSAAPEEAVRRMRGSDRKHFLLDATDPADAVASVLQDRMPQRHHADYRLPTDGLTIEEVAFSLEQIVRTRRARA